MNIAKLEGHTDAVWDVCLLASGSPSTSSAGATGIQHSHINERIATASSDGTVKIWDVSPSMLNEDGTEPESGLAPSSGLKLSWHARGTAAEEDDGQHKKIIPTCLALCQSDMTHLAVGYQDAAIRIFEVETGKLVNTLKSGDDAGKII
jgi:striatin 1/3/4